MGRERQEQSRIATKTARNSRLIRERVPEDAADAFEIVKRLVLANAIEMAEAAVQAAKEGELGPLKYLFELTGIRESESDADEPPEEDSLSYRLLTKLGLPTEPEGARTGDMKRADPGCSREETVAQISSDGQGWKSRQPPGD